jgi:hypothetical protein
LDHAWHIEVATPSRRQSSATLSSPRSPSSTTRIFPSAENRRRVARQISFRAASANGFFGGLDVCLIVARGAHVERAKRRLGLGALSAIAQACMRACAPAHRRM